LKVSAVDLARKRILGIRRRVRMAWTHPTPVVIDDQLAAILAAWTPCLKCGWLFPGVQQIGPWRTGVYAGTCYGELKAACRAAGIEQITFKQLRRFHFEHAAHIPLAVIPPRVILGKKGEYPIVNRRRMLKEMTDPQHDVLSALLAAGENGLNKDEL